MDLVDSVTNFTDIHAKVHTISGFNFIGYQSRPMYIDEVENPDMEDSVWGYTMREGAHQCNAFNEEDAKKELVNILNKIQGKRTILVTHSPPYGILDQVVEKYREWGIKSYGDFAKSGNIGSHALRWLTEEYPISFHFFGHIHEGKGVARVGDTVYINTGSIKGSREYLNCVINQDSTYSIVFSHLE